MLGTTTMSPKPVKQMCLIAESYQYATILLLYAKKVKTALTLGLALQVHHDVGSMYLVDVLHNLGHCVSYDEVSRFTTSVAKDQISQAGDVDVLRGIQSVDL